MLILANEVHTLRALPDYWSVPVRNDCLKWIVHATFVAFLLRIFSQRFANRAFIAVCAGYFSFGLGILQSISAVLFFVSAYALGNTLLARPRAPADYARPTAATAIGVLLLTAFFSILLHFAVNFRLVYLSVLLGPLLMLAWSSRRASLVACSSDMVKHIDALPYPGLVLMVIVIGWVARFAFLPTVGYDDNTLHLRLWTDLLHFRYDPFNFHLQVWAVAPFALDLLYAIVSVVAGSDARGAVNFLLLLFLLQQLWAIGGRLQLRSVEKIFLVLLFASTPMLAYLLTSMQVELGLTVITTTCVRLILEQCDPKRADHSASILALIALACAVKLTGVFLASLLGVILVMVWWLNRNRRMPLETGTAALVVLALAAIYVAFGSYLQAWFLTGNPAFPLFNGIFHSPYFEAQNFVDSRYLGRFSLNGFLNIFFQTSKFNESQNYTAGFQYLFLLPAAVIIALWRDLDRITLIILMPLAGYGVVMFHELQYWRYLVPVLPLASALIARSFRTQVSVKGCAFAVACLSALNFYFLPGVIWWFFIPAGEAMTAHGRTAITAEIIPEKTLTSWINKHAPGSTVLYPSQPFGATLQGQPIYVNWYQPDNLKAFEEIKNVSEVKDFLRKRNVVYVIQDLPATQNLPISQQKLNDYLAQNGRPIETEGAATLYQVNPDSAVR